MTAESSFFRVNVAFGSNSLVSALNFSYANYLKGILKKQLVDSGQNKTPNQVNDSAFRKSEHIKRVQSLDFFVAGWDNLIDTPCDNIYCQKFLTS